MSHAEERPVLWTARVHAGEYLGVCDALSLLSTTSGEAELRNVRELLSSKAACHLAAMLINLSEASRYYRPLEPKTAPSPLMTMFVESVANHWTSHKVLVARLDFVLDRHSAFVSITTENEPRTDVPPVAYDDKDGVWDIVLKVLRTIFPMHLGL
ncbi:hypothetical protein [Paraburkholderia ginsengisoli]|uniref:Uncharacterized protein n=1 Tax=Paraburkholderia ginsengisoli TaxID=311231 RepID=A0A7T4T7Y7_9BURK|nr:hypothetical protein [Paraburkholderia ginsengisoli]QQC63124.1 hypothetical protein I6I06_12485 [Paraburkholderia ginsengisoli]